MKAKIFIDGEGGTTGLVIRDSLQALNDTNIMELRVYHNEKRGHVLLAAKLDNLGKGASGAAVQNLELMLGL